MVGTQTAVIINFLRVCGGEPYYNDVVEAVQGIFSACAEVNRYFFVFRVRQSHFLRVCGGEPPNYGFAKKVIRFSPRVRR